MITKLLRKVFRRQPAGQASPRGHARVTDTPAIIPRNQHGIRRDMISSAALRVCDGLQQQGYKAFVVGGAVRDLIAGITPKDFDVATNATPEQVVSVFRRARIIGRRFRIVHVMFGRDMIEVSTFRAMNDAETDEHGRILRDNVWGSQAEDAARRDFTVNALYYDPSSETVVDYHHGVADLKKKTMSMIGKPELRYREDPVRMLRAVRLSSKLGLTIDKQTRTPISEMADLLNNVPAARLFDEMLKLLTSGHALECLHRLRDHGLHHGLLPLLDVILEQPLGERFVTLALERTDQRVREGKSISPGFLFATLLWHEALANWEIRKARGEPPMPALFEAMSEVLDQQAEKLAITKRIAGDIKDIWALQPRLDQRGGRRAFRLLEQPRFRAGYDFLVLRGESGEVDQELVDWWTDFQEGDNDQREALIAGLAPDRDGAPKRRRRRRTNSRRREDGAEQAQGGAASGSSSDDVA